MMQLYPKMNIPAISGTKAYCAVCAKIREQELEPLNIEIRKVQAFEKIGSAFENSDNIVNALANIGSALRDIGSELERYNHNHR